MTGDQARMSKAAELVKCMNSDENQMLRAKQGGLVPTKLALAAQFKQEVPKMAGFTDAVGVSELGAELRRRGVPTGEVVRPSEELWGADASPDARVMVERLGAELAAALREGRTGLRISADMCWAARPQAGAEQLLAFENEVAKLFTDGRLTAICEYDREAFDPVRRTRRECMNLLAR